MFFSERFQNSSRSMPSASPDEMFWPMNVVGDRPVARSIQSSGLGRPSAYAFEPLAEPRELVISAVSIHVTVAAATSTITAFRVRAVTRGAWMTSTTTSSTALATSRPMRMVGWSQCHARFAIVAMP